MAEDTRLSLADSFAMQQDGTPASPSDRIYVQQDGSASMSLSDAVPSQSPAIQTPSSDQSPSAPNQSTLQPAPPSPSAATPSPAARNPAAPNVASLGNNRFNTLSRSGIYATPVALSLGVGAGSASSNVGSYFGTATHRNLLQTPEMFGDFRRPGTSLTFFQTGGSGFSYNEDGEGEPGGIDFPSAGSFSGMRVSENNVALPQDRIWTSYHHFNNAFALPTGDLDLDRFIIGFEKTFNGGSSSIEFRLPIAGSLDPVDPSGSTSFAGGSFGNLGVILKKVLYARADRVLAAGVRVETPTGSTWHASDTANGGAQFSYSPNAVYITPYLGALREINDIWFINSFLQLDIATGGDKLVASLGGNPAAEFKVDQPPLLQLDIGGGVWLVTRAQNRPGWAFLSELHIATALADDDTFAVDPTLALPNVFVDENPIRTVVNATNGLHCQLSDLFSVRAALSVPLLNDRIFDSEFMVQVNRSF